MAVLGIALGVAVVFAMDLAVESSREALRASVTTVGGQATHRVVAGDAGIPSELVAELRRLPGVRAAAPVVEGYGRSLRLPGRSLRLLGVDPLSDAVVRPHFSGDPSGLSLLDLLSTEGGVVLGRELAEELAVIIRSEGAGESEVFPVQVGGREVSLQVTGVLDPQGDLARAGLRDLLVMDIATAQGLVERYGVVDRVDLVLVMHGEGEDSVADAVGEVLPPGALLEPADARGRELEGMLRSFDVNLTALSLLALLFGGFLIYNTLTFSVVRRRKTLGTYRALGATRSDVLKGVVGEALVLGLLGTVIGSLLGYALGRGLVRLVTRTINDLYFVLSVEGVTLEVATLGKAVLLGMGVTVAASLPAAWEAASTPPRRALARSFVEGRARDRSRTLALIGLLLCVAGGALLIPRVGVELAFAGLFVLVLGMALVTPWAATLLLRPLVPAARRVAGLVGVVGARGVTASLSRTGPAMAALVVAVAVTLSLGVMITSFRGSVEAWLDATLASDVYVSLPSAVSARPHGTLPPATVEALVSAPEVAEGSLTRRVQVLSPHGEVALMAVSGPPEVSRRFPLLAGSGDAALRVLEGEGVLVSEPLAFRLGLEPGDELSLRTDRGVRSFPVQGVFRDYGSDRGVAVLSRNVYLEHWNDPGVTSLGLDLAEGVDGSRALALLGSRVPPDREVSVRSNEELRAATLQVFDRTFRVTSVLQLLVFSVAFVGVLSALMALQLERERELGVLRAQGMTNREVGGTILIQSGLMGVSAGLLALPAGMVLAWVMIHVVNARSFGWSVDPLVSPGVVAASFALAFFGALLAGVYPAWRMARISPSVALKGE